MSLKRMPLFVLLCALAQCEERSESPPSAARARKEAVHEAEPPRVSVPEPAPVPRADLFFVAVIDSGIDADHPLFKTAFADADVVRPSLPEPLHAAPGTRFLGWDLVDHSAAPRDHTGHGTHVAGILVRESFSGAPEPHPRLLVMRTGDKKHTLPRLTEAVSLVTGMKRRGFAVPVVLLPMEYYPERHEAAQFALFEQALKDLVDQDTLAICAAGNRARDNDDPSGTSHCYPSDFPFANLLSVAACNESGHLHALSNYGATSVDLAAPGFGVESAGLDGGTARETGSSQAAAYVAARAVQLARTPGISGAETIRKALLKQVRVHPSLVGRTRSNGYLPRIPSPPDGTPDGVGAQPLRSPSP